MPEAQDTAATLWSQAALIDPYPIYRRLQSETPISMLNGSLTLTRYADVLPALRDPRLLAARINPTEAWLTETGLGPLFHAHSKMMLFSDPPDHTRLRSLVNKAFTPRVVENMRPHIQQIVDDLLDRVEDAGRMDVIEDLAYPLPVTVIAELLGIPLDRREQFRHWSDHIAAFIGGTSAPEEQMLRDALQTVLEMTEYFRAVAAKLRVNPRDDLLSALALAEVQGDRLHEDELVANCILLLVAGHETTTNLVGNGVLALLKEPEQLQRLKDDPELIGTAVEEFLRFDSPVQGTSRMAGVDFEIGGQQLVAGQHVSLMIGAANRDPAQFPDPNRLDIGRRENRHLSFSHGAHFCLGAPLARLEGRIAIGTLVQRMPRLELATEMLEWRDNFTLRGVKALPVTF